MPVSKGDGNQFYTFVGGGFDYFAVRKTSNGTMEQYSAHTFTDGVWHLFTATWNNTDGKIRVYKDGVLDITSSGSLQGTLSSTSYSMYISAGAGGNSYYVDGDMDEVRMSASARSADWIATEYANQSSPSTFYAVEGD